MVHVVYAAFEPMFEDEVVDAEPVFEDGEMEEVEPGVWAPRETAEELSKPARAPFSANTPRELAELLREAYDKIVVDLEDDFLTPAHAEASVATHTAPHNRLTITTDSGRRHSTQMIQS